AVGATLFLLASGRPVHEGNADEQRRAAYREDARSVASLVPDLPPVLVATVDRALLRDPSIRFQSAEQMRDSLLGTFHPADVAAAPFQSASRRPLSEAGIPRRPQEPPQRTALSDSVQRHPTEQDRELGPVLSSRPGTALAVVSSPDTWAPRKRDLSPTSELLIGRDAGPLGWSFADTRVSRVHARVAWDERQGCFRATDLNSTNGMRVNAVRKTTMPLSSGDVLRVGDTVLVVSQGPTMAELRATVEQAARSTATLLITGETGVGKEVISRQIHAWSGRSGAFVPVNCGALPRDIAASELFGHAKGAFSGAASARRGVFHAAQGGTILLDEVGELPLELQPLLLRTLQEKAVRPVGTDHEQPIDVRVIAATNVKLDSAVAEGLFRADLYARLAQIPIELPPLRQRREEVLALAATFATQASAQFAITADAAEALLLWSWPFNVRELENLIRRWCAMTQPGTPLGLEFLHGVNPAMTLPFQERSASQAPSSNSSSSARSPSNSGTPARNPLSDRTALEALLVSCEGNVSEVARRLNTTRAQVYRWMDRLGLDASKTRSSSPPRRA
ncbi:MAG TPA: sigma 54-interacting transcriptional regulator, partial [Polyangiaceae bacterium]|nr:sigma 54-interacting transcriptional regulator [Polyangiaceae bacterium]